MSEMHRILCQIRNIPKGEIKELDFDNPILASVTDPEPRPMDTWMGEAKKGALKVIHKNVKPFFFHETENASYFHVDL